MTDSTALTTTQQGVFSGIQAFEDAQRIAKALASSTLIPPQFQGQQGFANCLVAMEIAARLNLSPFLVMQHVHVIHGRPSFSSQFLIALVNGCGEFSPLRFELKGEGDGQACRCTATDLKSGELLEGPWVSIAMAKKEGWASKNGSKWATMPELMLRYRAAAFWQRLFASHLTLGFKTEEEVIDVEPSVIDATPSGVLVSDWIRERGCAKSSAYKWLAACVIRPRREVNRATGKVESWLTDEQAATLTAYVDALFNGAKPSEAQAVIGRGPMVAPSQVPGSMPPPGWEPMAPEPVTVIELNAKIKEPPVPAATAEGASDDDELF